MRQPGERCSPGCRTLLAASALLTSSPCLERQGTPSFTTGSFCFTGPCMSRLSPATSYRTSTDLTSREPRGRCEVLGEPRLTGTSVPESGIDVKCFGLWSWFPLSPAPKKDSLLSPWLKPGVLRSEMITNPLKESIFSGTPSLGPPLFSTTLQQAIV